ncbi:hypothetical protein GGR51DRAFT_304544 [Nemania sp. FL0031]|nr:hypothetical protein GGR51DRAFT_304544 [Nemania sp. FL0031]
MLLDRRRSRLKAQRRRQFTMSANPTSNSSVPDASSSNEQTTTSASSSEVSSTSSSVESTTSTTSTPSSTSQTSTSTSETSTSSSTPTSTSTTSSTPPPTSTTTTEPSSTETTTSSTSSTSSIFTTSTTTTPFTSTPSSTNNDSTETTTVTSFASAGSSTATTTSASGTPTLNSGSGDSSNNLNQTGKIAVAVVVPIAGVALIVLAGLFFWRRRKQRKDAEEQRRKEVEDYAYNPNVDPTLPNLGGAGAYEMKEDASSGYRGWGSTTLAGSTGRKASTTMSGGGAGGAFSDGTSPARGDVSDTRSGEPLMSDGSRSPEGEILGAMGPSSADNRGVNVHRGPSNASSSYSAAGRSDGSGDNVAYGSTGYYDQYGNSNPYSDPYTDNPNGPLQPVIRDNPARRNTRIESPSHYPQQSAGISQNF